jgi:adenine-specific DNA methylase
MTGRRFIEEYFPVREVSEHSAKVKATSRTENKYLELTN